MMTQRLQKEVRQSNFELLRIVAMFLVLVLHSNFIVLGSPTSTEISTEPLSSFARIFTQSASVVCVNVFVLISGWFAIRPKAESFCRFIFQCLFFSFGIYAVALLCKTAPLSPQGLKTCIPDWFPIAYIGLYIMSPVLNAFIDQATPRKLGLTVLFFYIYSTLFGLTTVAHDFERGYSLISFMGLYMLGRYVHLYPLKIFRLKKKYDLLIYVALTLLCTLSAFLPSIVGLPDKWGNLILIYGLSYLYPPVILSALYLLLFFSKLHFTNKAVNWVAASCFAVYLLHTNDNIFPIYLAPQIQHDATLGTLPHIFYNFLLIVIVYVAAILIDKIRLLLWHKMWH
jgi:hypothetical protein